MSDINQGWKVRITNDSSNPASVTGNVNITASGLPLPSGAATSANQVSGNTSLNSIDTKTPALQSGAVPVGDNSGSLTVDGKAYRATVTVTRPSNATPYTAGDVVGDTGGSAIITLSGIGPSGGYVLVQSVSLVFSDTSVPSGMGAFRLHLYNASPTATADNAPFDLASGERSSYMGYVDLAAPADFGSSLYTQTDYAGRQVKLASASTTLYAELETRGAYTPVSGSTVDVRVATLEAGL